MAKSILLLDVDGVLVHARGYEAGIQATVQYFIERMQQPHLTPPTQQNVKAFEAQGIIFEWDSTALCLASLLNQVPEIRADDLETSLNKIAHNGIRLEQPDYTALAQSAAAHSPKDRRPCRATLGTLFPNTPLFQEVLSSTHLPTSPAARIFQHFALGDEQFARTYGEKPLFETESLIQKLDQPILSVENA